MHRKRVSSLIVFARKGLPFIVIVLVIAAAFLFDILHSSSGLDLTFHHGAIVAGAEAPLEVTIRAKDGRAHENVRLTWQLPPWVEVIQADPLLEHQAASLGRISPGEQVASRLIVRIRNVPSASVPVLFSVREETKKGERYTSGEETLEIASAALTAASLLPSSTIVAGASIPITIQNNGNLAAPAVILRLLEKRGAEQSGFYGRDAYPIGELAPGEQQTVLLTVDPDARGSIDLVWELQDAARAMDRGTLHLEVGESLSSIPTEVPSTISTDEFDVSMTTQYAAPSGDQLGIGPNPPRAGETTTYWIVWSVTSKESDLTNLMMRGTLAPDVRATGRYASVIPGTFKKTTSSVTWSVPSLSFTGGDPARFAFEVAVTPTSSDRGEDPVLIQELDATQSK